MAGDQLNRLGEAYANGVVSKAVYERKRDELLTLLARASSAPSIQEVGAEALMPLLKDLPILLVAATNSQRRAAIRELATQVYVRKNAVIALRPTRMAERLITLAVNVNDLLTFVRWWAGWAPGTRSDTPYTLLHPRRVAA